MFTGGTKCFPWSAANSLLRGLALVLLAVSTVQAQVVPAPNENFNIDPISFNGPDPERRFRDIKIEQKLDAEIPLDLAFTDENGDKVKLRDYFGDRPVILSLVYYECPSICNEVLNGMVGAFDAADNSLDIGTDYEVVTVSIAPKETPELAKAKKASYLKQMLRPGGDIGWHFLTGEQANIETLATAVGFRYFYDAKENLYAHDSGIMVCTSGGRVSSYMLGIRFLPENMKMALVDAGEGKIGSKVDQLVLLCYAYDPATASYGFYVIGAVRIGATLLILAMLAFWGSLYLASRKKVSEGGGDSGGTLEQGLHES